MQLKTAGTDPGRSPPSMAHQSQSADVPRLGRPFLLGLLVAVLALLAIMLGSMPFGSGRLAGSPPRQTAAILGAVLLFVPVLFSVTKRGGLSDCPPAWFVAHVLASSAGLALICFHGLGGSLLSPPGVVLGLLFFLVLQGTLARIFLSARFSQQFGSRASSFQRVDGVDRAALAAVIERKRALLATLDPAASESVFSPNLRHALRHPWLTLKYARLVAAESRVVGARRRAGTVLSLWRRVHIAAAIAFVCGLILHVVVVTFFAAYAAGGRAIYWWHLAAWGA